MDTQSFGQLISVFVICASIGISIWELVYNRRQAQVNNKMDILIAEVKSLHETIIEWKVR